jgi:hypothetical protein
MKRTSLLLLVFAGGAALAQEKPSEHPFSAPIVVEGVASHYRFAIPAAAYRGASRRDLGDLRVFNAAGEPVPYAFAPREAQSLAPVLSPVNSFPLRGDRDKGLESANVRVERSHQGTVVNVSVVDAVPAARRKLIGYLIDASELKAPQEALILTWNARQGFSGYARVEGSEDLSSWHVLASNAPILSLEHAGARLERNRVELRGARAKYLRVSFQQVAPDFELKAVRVELRPDRAEPPREWLSASAVPGKLPGELLLDTQGHFPVDRIRLALPQPNTVAQIQLFTRERPEDPWRAAATATAYRLARERGDLTNPDIRLAVNLNRYWRIVVDQKGGGFGAGEVRVELGWLPHEVLFVARGTGPFTAAYGSKSAKPGALPVSAVLPGDEAHQVAAAGPAKLGEVSGAPPAPPTLFSEPARFFRSITENPEAKKWTLWVALLAGVLMLGWMALRLLRDMGNSSRDPRNP